MFIPSIRTADVIDASAFAVVAGSGLVPDTEAIKEVVRNFEAVQLPGTGHFLIMEKRDEFNRLLRGFLDDIGFRGAGSWETVKDLGLFARTATRARLGLDGGHRLRRAHDGRCIQRRRSQGSRLQCPACLRRRWALRSGNGRGHFHNGARGSRSGRFGPLHSQLW